MASRRRRKRRRRAVAEAGSSSRGDRPATARRGQGELLFHWAEASRGDLALLRKAILEEWPIPGVNRGPLLEEAVFPLFVKDKPRPPGRLLVAAFRAVLAADAVNLKYEVESGLADPDAGP